ncbi:hypothetical protein [Catenovulum adriaticum]|uniref:beta-fructofuranosidase n=1 Tax=Catenovulum adriaticum TaxID=2984846 RepID=A0ABY7ATZ8_9ALTE|nr:hypothetical protein [Catenovulum sp. TS8]WAJ71995.1 hypothetical protein OLW01_14840 [Catenovulum sp. TS8]
MKKNNTHLLMGILFSSSLYSTAALAEIPITENPEQSGTNLFFRPAEPWQNISGFEFCCGGFDSYQKHGFSQASGDFVKLDGGQWAAGIAGSIGDRAFVSYGDGYEGEWDNTPEHIGWHATGSIRSPEFTIEQNYINFKVGGGSNRFDHINATSVVLVVNGEWERHASGQNIENQLDWQTWDVSEFIDQNAYILFLDMHPADGSDTSLAYLLADEFRADNAAAVEPSIANWVNPANAGVALFTPDNLADFEFCCAGAGTYAAHGFTNATADFNKLDGGFWAADISGAIGQRIFSSYGDGAIDEQGNIAQLGGEATGTLDSPEFTINHNFINFLVGGGSNRFDAANATSVVLLVDGAIVRHASGNNQANKLSWASWDVSEFFGNTAQLRFIDIHPDDKSDNTLPYLLADDFRAADSPVVTPDADSVVNLAAELIYESPELAGEAAFSRLNHPQQHIAGFEFCCGGYDAYHQHNFLATGDFIRFDGGLWADGIANHVGDRIFASYGQGYANNADTTGTWYGGEATGQLISPEFTITQPYINLLTAGGTNTFASDNATAVVLRVNGKIVRHATGNGLETELNWTSWDTSGLFGQQAVIEIIDQHDNTVNDGSLPFILVDEIRQADKAAVAPLTSSIVSQIDGHKVALQLNMGDANPYYENGEFYIYYLQNSAYHSWYLSKTDDLLTGTFTEEVLAASGDHTVQDQWTGSGSVMKDQNGQYHLFYTGHNKNHYPVEAVMHAVATDNTLKNWQTINEHTFTGSNGYSDYDFRDPFVFWNEDEQRYWMLITSRYNNQAAIGLYTSTDLASWTAQAPLYTENSPLNLEVPEYFELADTPFVVYSDQRSESPVVKYLIKQNNQWVKPDWDALDGRYFYAARSAGPENERLLFGWVPHTDGRNDGAAAQWGGDLIMHQLHKKPNGELAVKFPDRLKAQFKNTLPLKGQSDSNLKLRPKQKTFFAAHANKNLLEFSSKSKNPNAKLAILLRNKSEKSTYKLLLNSRKNTVTLIQKINSVRTVLADVKVNLNPRNGIKLQLYSDPVNGIGSLYINEDKALTFRLYQLKDYTVGIKAKKGMLEVSELSRIAL